MVGPTQLHIVDANSLQEYKLIKSNALIKLADNSIVAADVYKENGKTILIIQRVMPVETLDSITGSPS